METYSGVTCYNLFDKETPNQILSKEEISEQNLNYRNANYLNKIIEEAPCKIGNQQFEVKIACYPDTSNKRGIQIFYKFKDDVNIFFNGPQFFFLQYIILGT